MGREWTKEQSAAIAARGKTLLVSAAAGSGKTATLTERIIRSLLDPEHPADLSRLLIVTFTNAAVEELRERIDRALREALRAHPENAALERQLFLLPTATICTIDAFCNDILKNNAEAAGLPSGYRVADPAEVALIRSSVMTSLIEGYYAGAFADTVPPEDFAELCDCLTVNRSDAALEECFTYLYLRTETHEAGVAALRPLVEEYRPRENFTPEGTRLGAALMRDTEDMLAFWHGVYREQVLAMEEEEGEGAFTSFYRDRLDTIGDILAAKTYRERREYLAAGFPPSPRKTRTMPAAAGECKERVDKEFAKDMEFLCKRYFAYTPEEFHCLYVKLYKITGTLSRFLEEFDRTFRAEKRRLCLCEYSDMETYACRALYDGDEPSELALSLRERYEAVYIDEYQDVNRLQNRIFAAVSRPDNRFTVGDIKQSIYGFRSADPSIFAGMKASFPPYPGTADVPEVSLFMADNFRCDRVVVDFVNAVFDRLFSLTGESIGYVDADRLRFAKKYAPGEVVPARPVHILHVVSPGRTEEDGEDAPELSDNANRREAAAIADKIEELLAHGTKNDGSPLLPSDIAVLVRSVASRGRDFQAEFEARGIACESDCPENFLRSPEVLLTLCYLNAIDNPCRDVYLSGLMLSPLFGFMPDELTAIRRTTPKGEPLYRSLLAYVRENPAFTRGADFLSVLARYRRLSEGMKIDRFLYRLYRETGLLGAATEHGRQENLLLLYEYARKFEQSSYQGLYAFISYLGQILDGGVQFSVRKQEAGDPGRIHLLTVHHSKGLEYPVVFLAGCGAQLFTSRMDAGERFISYRQDFGAAVSLPDDEHLSLIDNPACAVIDRENRRAEFEEELRVLYVALTRARERLYITGCVRDEEAFAAAMETRSQTLTPYAVRRLGSYLELIEVTGAPAVREVVSPLTAAERQAAQERAVREAEETASRDETVLSQETVLQEGMSAVPGESPVRKNIARMPENVPCRPGEATATEKVADASALSMVDTLPGAAMGQGTAASAVSGASAHILCPGADPVAVCGKEADTTGEKRPCGAAEPTLTPQEEAAREAALEALFRERFSYRYPDPVLTTVPAKLSVSFLSPGVLDEAEEEEEERLTIDPVPSGRLPADAETFEGEDMPRRVTSATTETRQTPPTASMRRPERHRLPDFVTGHAADESARRGTATHRYLQFCDFEHLLAAGEQEELERLCEKKFLSAADGALVRLPEIGKFRGSALLGEMHGAAKLWRELRFNVLLPARNFTADPDKRRALGDRKLLVQGVIDCLLQRPDGSLWLVDYKTDRLTPEELADPRLAAEKLTARHRLQLSYYAAAVERMFGKRPARILIYSLPLGDTVEVDATDA